MASMEDLIATVQGGMHVGQQANDLKDLQAKLSQTLHPTLPIYRPVPPSSAGGGGPDFPPAPASSWNSPPPVNNFLSSSPYTARQMAYPTGAVKANGQRDVGFSVPGPNTNTNTNSSNSMQQSKATPTPGQNDRDRRERPYHAEVLPVKASPVNTNGFAEDAFKPLWSSAQPKQNGGFGQK